MTLDLRNSTLGDYGAMRECLELILPRGTFGTVARSQVGQSRRLEIKTGAVSAIKVNLIVDGSTRGAAQGFAHALVDAGVAKVTGGDLTDETPWIETILLPDGSGYTLRTGDFKGKQAGGN